MTKEALIKLWSILEAWKNGKEVEIKVYGKWEKLENESPLWGDPPENYRIKLEPREFWMNKYLDDKCSYAYETKEAAERNKSNLPGELIKVREVLD